MNWHTLFDIDKNTWTLHWKIKPSMGVDIGDPVSPTKSGLYVCFMYKYKTYRAHRVIWEMLNGPIPEGMEIDHIDTNKLNNNINNLRLSCKYTNKFNTNLRQTSITKIKGLSINTTKWNKYWKGSIMLKGKTYSIYRKYTEEGKQQVIDWLVSTRKRLHKEFANHG